MDLLTLLPAGYCEGLAVGQRPLNPTVAAHELVGHYEEWMRDRVESSDEGLTN